MYSRAPRECSLSFAGIRGQQILDQHIQTVIVKVHDFHYDGVRGKGNRGFSTDHCVWLNCAILLYAKFVVQANSRGQVDNDLVF